MGRPKSDDRGVQSFSNNKAATPLKCTRCRVKRTDETTEELTKFRTCIRCRSKRRVARKGVDLELPNTYTNYKQFLEQIKNNSHTDIIGFRYVSPSPSGLFKRYDQLDSATYQQVSKQLVDEYIVPLMTITGYRFVIRDYHKGGRKSSRVNFTFICSQDKGQQRKTRSKPQSASYNDDSTQDLGLRVPGTKGRLKVEQCESKITLSYDLGEGMVVLTFSHKAHDPYNWRRHNHDSVAQYPGEPVGQSKTDVYTSSIQQQQQQQQQFIPHPIMPFTQQFPIPVPIHGASQYFPPNVPAPQIPELLKAGFSLAEQRDHDAAAQIIAVAQSSVYHDKRDSVIHEERPPDIDRELMNLGGESH